MPPIPKEPTVKLAISTEAYHEIFDALAAHGYKPGQLDITLTKSMELKQPVDFRLASMRRDAGLIAARQNIPSNQFVSFMEEIYQYIINGKQPVATKEWK